MKKKHISVVIPLYKCEPFIQELNERLIKTLSSITTQFEIIYVNDASPFNDWIIVSKLAQDDLRIKGLNLSRNFGQHNAITAGLSAAVGKWIVVMDGDLQDKPEEISKLYKYTNKGFEIIQGQRLYRKDSFLKIFYSRLFYFIFGYLTNTQLDSRIANFGIYHKKAIQGFLDMKDETRYFPTMIQWVGFEKTIIPIEHGTRKEGTSSYSFKKLCLLATNNIIAFSDKPLYLVIKFGLLIAIFSFLSGIYYIILHQFGKVTELGFTSIIISIWFLSGVIISTLGMVGVYVGKLFDKSKNRPNFIVKNKINLN